MLGIKYFRSNVFFSVYKPELFEEAVSGDEVAEEEEEIIVRRGPSTPKPWISLGSEDEVTDENVIENRPKVIDATNLCHVWLYPTIIVIL